MVMSTPAAIMLGSKDAVICGTGTGQVLIMFQGSISGRLIGPAAPAQNRFVAYK